MREFEFDNYIFDLYGTLIDIRTDEHAEETWNKWVEYLDGQGLKHPAPMAMQEEFFAKDRANRVEALASWGFTVPEIDVTKIYKEMFIAYGNDEELFSQEYLDEIGYAFRSASREYMRLFPGVEDFLRELRETGRHAYILSNAQRSYTWPEICAFGLEKMVDDVLISSDYRCMKPDTVFFNAMINKHSLDKTGTVMVGDSKENDYEGGLAAGINAIWLGPDNPAREFYV